MLTLLRLRQFRSYKDYVLELEPGVNIIIGPNASGKTNLLEALCMVCLGRSFRGSLRETIMDGKSWARIDGHTKEDVRTLKIAPPLKPQLFINDKLVKQKDKPTYPVCLFEPDHLRLINGSPKRRREYLDETLIQTDSQYKEHLSRYMRALAQRNRLLKSGRVSEDELFVWDMKLAEHGAKLVSARGELVSSQDKKVGRLYSAVAGKKHQVSLKYTTNTEAEISRNLSRLHAAHKQDLRLGFTTIGPHRDDIAFSIDKQPAENHASRGEVRSIVVALKIIEIETLTRKLGRKPLVLLDDVFSELDAARRQHLTDYLKGHQTVITTTDADAVIEHFSSGEYKIVPTTKKN